MTKDYRFFVSCHCNEVCAFRMLTMSSNTIIHSFYNRSNWEIVSQRENASSVPNASISVKDTVVFQTFSYYLIGSLMIVIMVIGFSTNLAILYTYATNRKVRTVDNTLIIGLALSDIGQSIFGIPFVAISSFSKKWIFGHVLCQYYAFITTSFGIAQIAMLTVIAMERYFVIVRHDRRLTNTPCRCVIMILGSFLYGSSWATGPLLGWSGYKEEEIGIACCVKWEIKDSLSLSYTISLCTFGWLIPLFLIAFGYLSIACSIYNERNKRLYMRRQVNTGKTNREKKVAITVLIMIGAFIVSWTPYCAVSLWSAIGNFEKIPLWVQVVPAVFAKCSIIWNPVIYVARHENFRQGIKQSFSHLKLCDRQRDQSNINRINSYQQQTGREQPYKPREIHNVDDRKMQSVTSDNYVTYVDSPARSKSSSSVFIHSPKSSYRRNRYRRHLTYFSTLDSSQQIMERSEIEYLKTENGVVPTETKWTQTDARDVKFYNFKQMVNQCVQTDYLSSLSDMSNVSESPKYFNAQPHNDSEKLSQTENDDDDNDNERPDNTWRLYETGANGNASPSNVLENTNTVSKNNTFKKVKSLEILKEKRNELKRQLEIIYQETHRIERSPVQTLNCAPTDIDSNQNVPLIRAENRTWQRKSSINKNFSSKPNLPKNHSLTKEYSSLGIPISPYSFHRRENFRKMKRERIISEPTKIEMKTYIYKPFATRSQSIKDTTTDTEMMMNTYFVNEKPTIVRQSTV